jgi:hypothetical protein
LIGGDITEQMVRNKIDSNNPQYRHWKVDGDWDITYDEMYELWGSDIRLDIPTIRCEGRDFSTISDAAKYFKLSSERIRQKLQNSLNPEYTYLYK